MQGKVEISAGRKTLFSIVAITLVVGITLVALEGVVRVRQWIIYGSPNSLQEFTKDDRSGLRIPKASSEVGNIRVNSLGFRGPEIPLGKPKGMFRLAFLGGSTTWCAEVSNNEATWPDLVWMELQKKYPSRKFDYVNGGVPGYSTSESLVNLQERVQPTNPDIIFIYHATNDISYDTRKLAIAQGIYSGKPENTSWLANYSLAWFLIEKNLQMMLRKQQVKDVTKLLQFEPNEISRDFRKRLTLLIQESKKITPLVAIATFSHQYRREQSSEVQLSAAGSAIFYMPYMDMDRLFKAFESYNKVIRDVAKEEAIILIEDENYIPGDNVNFNDSVHFKDAGSKKMADRVLRGLLMNEDFRHQVEVF